MMMMMMMMITCTFSFKFQEEAVAHKLAVVVAPSLLKAAIHSIDASHWQNCLCYWKKLQRAVPRPRYTQHSKSDGNCHLTSNDTSAVDYSPSPAEDVGSKSAVKRLSEDLVTFRVSGKCAGRTLPFNSQVRERYVLRFITISGD